MLNKLSWTKHPDLIFFYKENRNSFKDLYISEKRFLPWLAKKTHSVLDAGCAAGGFSNIWRHYNKKILYSGLDLSLPLIKMAKKLYPNLKFFHLDVSKKTKLPNSYAEVVQALGWLHWELRYIKAIFELWRLTSRYLFFDLRFSLNNSLKIRKQKLVYKGEWDSKTTTPYIISNFPLFLKFLLTLKPLKILGYGYQGKPANTVIGIKEPICFAAFVLEKASLKTKIQTPLVCIDLPLKLPRNLINKIKLLSSSKLEMLVPRR